MRFLKTTGFVLLVAFLSLSASSPASASCWFWERGYTKTRYPIVLAHGAFGFDDVYGIVDYWYEIGEELSSCAGARVFTTEVSSSNSTEARGEQLLAQVQEILAQTGAEKVNLIGHSMGGLDCRYVAEVRPDLVASVTTIASPHKGTEVFETFAPFIVDPSSIVSNLTPYLNEGAELLYGLIGNGNPVDMAAAIEAQLPEAQQAWNESYPHGIPTSACGETSAVQYVDGNRIYMYSWVGDNPVPYTSSLQPITSADLAINTVMGVMDSLSEKPTDGFVEVCSAHFGEVLRDDYNWNHLDEINQLLGVTADFETDPVSVFRKHANRLKNLGL